jgi:hypothetical protein
MTLFDIVKKLLPNADEMRKSGHVDPPRLMRMTATEVFAYPERYTDKNCLDAIALLRSTLRYVDQYGILPEDASTQTTVICVYKTLRRESLHALAGRVRQIATTDRGFLT